MNPPDATALIAEDEPLLATALRDELARAGPRLRIAATVGDGVTAVAQALALRPDVLFFDIRMPGQSGLEASELFARTAAALGKEAEFVVHGVETEIDKVLADELADPLLHILRNALDHGIESPEERLAAGKPRRGRVTLNVSPRGREVVLTFSDDGRWRPGRTSSRPSTALPA